MRDGTRNSRAPSGVDGTSIGVSTSTKPCPSMAPRMAALTVERSPQVLLHPLPTEVEVAVLEPDVLVDVVGAGVDRERRRVGLAEHLDDTLAELDLRRSAGSR